MASSTSRCFLCCERFSCGHMIAARSMAPVNHSYSCDNKDVDNISCANPRLLNTTDKLYTNCWYCSDSLVNKVAYLEDLRKVFKDTMTHSKIMAEKVTPFLIDKHNTATVMLYNTFALHRYMSKDHHESLNVAFTDVDRIIKAMVKKSAEEKESVVKEKARVDKVAAQRMAKRDTETQAAKRKAAFEKVATAEADAEWEKVGGTKDVMDTDWVVLDEEDW